jgi:hypothetical protein
LALSASVETVCVAPDRIAEIWPHVRGHIAAAAARGGNLTEKDVAEALSLQKALLWVRTDGERLEAACVTQLIRMPDGLTCDVMACGGQASDWQAAFAPIESYAKEEGCEAIRIEGREGWKRVFPGYRLSSITLTKRLK